MKKSSIRRREFLRRSAALAAGTLALPCVATSTVRGSAEQAAPSERITVGCIGTGNRGNAVMGGFLGQKNAQIVAISDTKKAVLESTKARVDKHYGGSACATYGDFQDLVARKDIDAVLVATPDHWHVLTSMAAAKAGKDVYMEKPMGLNMAECVALRKTLHDNKRVFQYGTQQRSDAKFRLACELARNERIGKLKTIRVWSPGSSSGGSTEPAPIPEGLDYDRWLGPAPYTPYTPKRCSNSLWWFISDYALGFIAGWGIHPLDIADWGGGDKLKGPIEVEGTGEFPTKGVCDTALNWRIKLKYSSGILLDFAGSPMPKEWQERYPGCTSHGTAFEGTEGWVHVRRGLVNSNPEGMVNSKIGPDEVHLYQSNNHVGNFLDCVKSRKDTVAPIDDAVRSETLCQISEIAIRLKRKVKWDTKTETFPGDDEANKMLSKKMRAPWSL